LFILFFGKARLRLFLLKAFSSAFLFGSVRVASSRFVSASWIRLLMSVPGYSPSRQERERRRHVSDFAAMLTDFPK